MADLELACLQPRNSAVSELFSKSYVSMVGLKDCFTGCYAMRNHNWGLTGLIGVDLKPLIGFDISIESIELISLAD